MTKNENFNFQNFTGSIATRHFTLFVDRTVENAYNIKPPKCFMTIVEIKI